MTNTSRTSFDGEADSMPQSSGLERRIERQRELLRREAAALSERRAAIRKALQRKDAADRRERARLEREAALILGSRLLSELTVDDPTASLMFDAWRAELGAVDRSCIERALAGRKAARSGMARG